MRALSSFTLIRKWAEKTKAKAQAQALARTPEERRTGGKRIILFCSILFDAEKEEEENKKQNQNHSGKQHNNNKEWEWEKRGEIKETSTANPTSYISH